MDRTKPKLSMLEALAGAAIIAAVPVTTVAASVAALVFGAYGCGKLFARWLPFSAYEATVVSLLALVPSVWVAAKLSARFLASSGAEPGIERCDLCGKFHDVRDRERTGEEAHVVVDMAPNDGLRLALFSTGAIKPNAPCPCGSDRRYSRCCGHGRLFRQRESRST